MIDTTQGNEMNQEAQSRVDPAIWHELAKDELVVQLGFIDAIDVKLGTFLATGSALIGILGGVSALRPQAIKGPHVAVLVVAGALYLIIAAVTLLGLMTRKWRTGPDSERLRGEAERLNYTDQQVRWEAYFRYVKDLEKNRRTYWVKRWALRIVLVGLFLETVSVAIGLWFSST